MQMPWDSPAASLGSEDEDGPVPRPCWPDYTGHASNCIAFFKFSIHGWLNPRMWNP